MADPQALTTMPGENNYKGELQALARHGGPRMRDRTPALSQAPPPGPRGRRPPRALLGARNAMLAVSLASTDTEY